MVDLELRWVDHTTQRGTLTQCLLYAGTLSHEVAQLDRSASGKRYAVLCWLPNWETMLPAYLPLRDARLHAEQQVRQWFAQAHARRPQPWDDGSG